MYNIAVSLQCFFTFQFKSNDRMVSHELKLSKLVHYKCLTVCLVASGFLTPRDRHSRTDNLILENLAQTIDLSLPYIVKVFQNIVEKKNMYAMLGLFVYSWLQDSGFRRHI